MPSALAAVSRVVLDLVFPPRCALCGRPDTLLCGACIDTLPAASGDRCDICFMPASMGGSCRQCVASPPAFTSLRSAFVMDAGARELVHALKYEGLTALAEPMALLAAERIAAPDADVVAAVPLHRGRERSRGYNQAFLLARGYARLAGLEVEPRALRRIRATAPLAKTMRREERLAIVEGAFAADRRAVHGRRILLVDDVATTGATLDACARVLLEAGAASVHCITWARAD